MEDNSKQMGLLISLLLGLSKKYYANTLSKDDIKVFEDLHKSLIEKGCWVENGYGHFLHCPNGEVISLEEGDN